VALEETALLAGDLGLCEEQAGRFADAYHHLRRALDAAPAQKSGEPWKRYQAAMVRVLDRVAIVFLTVTPTQALVVLDSRPIGRADGRYIALTPGKHLIAARLQGHQDAVQSLTVAAKDLPVVHLALTPVPAPSTPVPVPKGPRAAPSAMPGAAPAPAYPWYTPAAVVGIAAGATALVAIASFATAHGLEAERASLDRTGDFECAPDKPSPPSVCTSVHERGKQRDVAADVAIGTAIGAAVLAGVAGGLAIGLSRTASSPRIAPSVSASGGGIVLIGAW